MKCIRAVNEYWESIVNILAARCEYLHTPHEIFAFCNASLALLQLQYRIFATKVLRFLSYIYHYIHTTMKTLAHHMHISIYIVAIHSLNLYTVGHKAM